jgi:hypothetical protein
MPVFTALTTIGRPRISCDIILMVSAGVRGFAAEAPICPFSRRTQNWYLRAGYKMYWKERMSTITAMQLYESLLYEIFLYCYYLLYYILFIFMMAMGEREFMLHGLPTKTSILHTPYISLVHII